MSNKLFDYVVEDVRNWKRNKFHKSIISWKETKRVELGFAKAQKPWAILFVKVSHANAVYRSLFYLFVRLREPRSPTTILLRTISVCAAA